MPFENPLLTKLFEGILEGRPVEFRMTSFHKMRS